MNQEIQIRKRQKWGINTWDIHLSIPAYLVQEIDEEAKAQGITRSNVAAYLILCGLKAHTGHFILPSKNLIKERYDKRGGSW